MSQDPPSLPDFDALWNYDAPAETEADFRALLPAARASGDRNYLVQLLGQIARAEGLQMKFEAAAATLTVAQAQVDDTMKVARVRLLLERGRLLHSTKHVEEARRCFESAWDMARPIRADTHAVDAAHMLGILETGDTAVAWNIEAIAYAEQSSDPKARRWLASLYNNLGWAHHDHSDYATALDLFEKALAARRAEGRPGPIRIARWCVARALRSMGRIEESLAIQRELLMEHWEAGRRDGFVLEEIAECLVALDRPEEATAYFAAAHTELASDPWLRRDEPERLDRLRRLGAAAV